MLLKNRLAWKNHIFWSKKFVYWLTWHESEFFVYPFQEQVVFHFANKRAVYWPYLFTVVPLQIEDRTRDALVLLFGSQWISVDDSASVERKLNYAKRFNVAGAFVWKMEDGFIDGKCQVDAADRISTPFPLLRAVRSVFGREQKVNVENWLPNFGCRNISGIFSFEYGIFRYTLFWWFLLMHFYIK